MLRATIIIAAVFLAGGLLLGAAGVATAHTQIVRSAPEPGEELETVPERVQLFLEEPVEAEFSPLQVYDEAGGRVDEDNARVDPDAPTTLMVDLKDGLPAGSYTAEYRYTGVDGHVIEGSYQFSARSGSEPAVAEDEGTGSEEPASGGDSSSGPERGAASTALYAVLGIGALALGALALGGLMLRRR